MIGKSNPYRLKTEDLDLGNPFDRDIYNLLTRKPKSYFNKADFEREKHAYKEAVEKEPVTRKAGHTYVPRSFKKPGWHAWVPQSIENWDPEREAMTWIVGTHTTSVHSIEDVEALYREWLDKNRQRKGPANNFVTWLPRARCHHGIANHSFCAGCENWYLDVLDYLAKLRIQVLEYESQARENRRKTDEKLEREAAERERRSQQEKHDRSDKPMSGKMSTAHALEILGLRAGANKQEIQAAYNRLIKRLHPDVGGSDFFAKQLNAARDALLR